MRLCAALFGRQDRRPRARLSFADVVGRPSKLRFAADLLMDVDRDIVRRLGKAGRPSRKPTYIRGFAPAPLQDAFDRVAALGDTAADADLGGV